MASFLSRFNPVPGFPSYTGPYKVGTVDVEIPVSELDSPAPAPDNAADLETVQFRIFYPCQPDAKGKPITWLPAPQRDHLAAYIKFLGIGPALAQAASFIPRLLHYTTIPVIKNAPILEPDTPNKRWPTSIFSHGLGGCRNTYSQIVGSLASHGVVVICPEHRDGSSVLSHVRIPAEQHRHAAHHTRRVISYQKIPHDATDEVHDLRNRQLRIRLWELGLTHAAVLRIDEGTKPMTNLNKTTPTLDHLAHRLHVHDPGSIIFSGHSFGAATIVQFLKSVFYADRPELASMASPLYRPSPASPIRRQVTPQNVTVLLDMWCFPLLAKSTTALFNLPLPAYANDTPSSSSHPAPGGTAILAIESEQFHKWTEHLHATARALSPDPSAKTVSPPAFERPGIVGGRLSAPHFFYVSKSAHLNQSDFGVLFPWFTRRAFGTGDPVRVVRLNVRAVLQVLRVNGVEGVGGPWLGDLVEGGAEGVDEKGGADGTHDDRAILERAADGEGPVEMWHWVDIMGMGQVVDKKGDVKGGDEVAEKQEPEMAAAIEPNAREG